MDEKTRIRKIIKILNRLYPKPETALHHKNALELLISTILSAQCTDVRVNQVTPALFKKYRSAKDFAEANLPELEAMIRTTGFFRNKALSIQGACQTLMQKFGGKVPESLEELTELRGVGRKTANVVLGECFGVPGIVVDTHVKRLSYRLGFTRQTDPEKIEQDLMKVVPKKDWTNFSHQLIFHGRAICGARKPLCEKCELNVLCPKKGVV